MASLLPIAIIVNLHEQIAKGDHNIPGSKTQKIKPYFLPFT
jgi:hypothetical protein